MIACVYSCGPSLGSTERCYGEEAFEESRSAYAQAPVERSARFIARVVRHTCWCSPLRCCFQKKKGDVSPLSKLIDEVVEGKEELQAEPAAPPLDEKGFVSSRTASVKGAITSLGNMAISEDMDFHALFHEIDADKNGYIDKMELRAVLWVLWPQAADEKIIDQVYELIDDDNSGKIVEAEFVPKMEQLTKEFREEKQALREQRRAAKRAEQEERRKRERYMERPEIPYRELDIDRRWFSLLRLCRYGFAEPVADDPQARMERAEKKAEEIRIRKLFVELDTDGSGSKIVMFSRFVALPSH